MKIQLPLETWADLLPFVPRRQLVEIVKQLGDRQFASILQFFLTEVGQITFDHLRFVAPRNINGHSNNGGPAVVEVRKERPAFFFDEWQMPRPSDLVANLAEGPMPHNVKDFKSIQLSYFDKSVANFLRQFQRENKEGNSLLENVNLWFSSRLSLSPPDHDNTLMKIMAQLMPTIGKINSIQMCYISHLFGLHNFEGVHNYAQPVKAMLTKTRILYSNEPMSMFAFREWLYTPRTDGKPRELRIPLSATCTVTFTEDIKKDFTEATRPVSFFIYVRQFEAGENSLWQDCCLNNACTNERLVIKTADSHPMMFGYAVRIDCKKVVQISRYPMGATKEWIEANQKEIIEWKIAKQNRLIRFE